MNNSNSKWINIGITCTPRNIFPDSGGFKVEAQLCGDRGSPLIIGNAAAMKSLFMMIRSDEECQYMYLGTRSESYNDCSNQLFGIGKADFGGKTCLHISNTCGQSGFLAL